MRLRKTSDSGSAGLRRPRSPRPLSPIMNHHHHHLPAEETIMAEISDKAERGLPSGQGSARAKFDEAAASTKGLANQAISAGQDFTPKKKKIARGSSGA